MNSNKDLVVEAFKDLVAKNNQTTSLEVKNECHLRNLGIDLGQSEVSSLLREFYLESDEFERTMHPNGIYFIYTPKQQQPQPQQPDATTTTGKQLGKAKQYLGSLSGFVDPDLLKKYVAYEKDKIKEGILFDTDDQLEARRLFKTFKKVAHKKVTHENVRIITAKNFMKRNKMKV